MTLDIRKFAILFAAILTTGAGEAAQLKAPPPTPPQPAPQPAPASKTVLPLATTVDIEIDLQADPLNAEVIFTFSTNQFLTSPTIGMIALDENVSRDAIEPTTRRDTSSLLAFLSSANTKSEIWIGKTLDSDHQKASVKASIPELLHPVPQSPDKYKLAFQPIEGALKSSSEGAKGLSMASLKTIHLVVPRSIYLEDPNWVLLSESRNEYEYKEKYEINHAVTAEFSVHEQPWKDWLRINIIQFGSVFGFCMFAILTIYTVIDSIGGKIIYGKLFSSAIGALLLADISKNYYDTHWGWLDRNWWEICFILASIVSLIVRKSWLDIILILVRTGNRRNTL